MHGTVDAGILGIVILISLCFIVIEMGVIVCKNDHIKRLKLVIKKMGGNPDG